MQRTFLALLVVAAIAAQSPVVSPTLEPNRGQATAEFAFVARAANGLALLAGDSAVLRHAGVAMRMTFVGAARTAAQPARALPGRSHYLLGRDPSRWCIDVPQFAQVRFAGLYPGIDLCWHGNGACLEYDLELAPGADAARIAIRIDDADRVQLTEDGDLRVGIGDRWFLHRRPVCWQADTDVRREVAARYRLDGDILRFELGAHDPSRALVIDPLLVFGTLLGGAAFDRIDGLAVDADGSVVLYGETQSLDFPVQNGLPLPVGGGGDAFVARLSADGSTLLSSTYLGGSGQDSPNMNGLALDPAGNLVMCGTTWSPDFPTTPGCLQPVLAGGGDAFVCVLSPGGNALGYSTYLGGPAEDGAIAVAVDALGRIAFTGTGRAGFPTTPGAYANTVAGDADICVALLQPAGGGVGDLLYSTLLGGGLVDRGWDIAIDSNGRIHLCGDSYTNRAYALAPTTAGGFRRALTFAHHDTSFQWAGYYAVVTPGGNGSADLVYATFVTDRQVGLTPATGLALDGQGRACITGTVANAVLTTTSSAFDATFNGGGGDAYLAVVDPSLSGAGSLAYASYFGSTQQDGGRDVVVAGDGLVCIAGVSASNTAPPGTNKAIPFPTTPDALQRVTAGGLDATLTVLDLTRTPAAQIVYSTLVGGAGTDWGLQLRRSGNRVFLAGSTDNAAGFPLTQGAFDTTANGSTDGFVLRIDL